MVSDEPRNKCFDVDEERNLTYIFTIPEKTILNQGVLYLSHVQLNAMGKCPNSPIAHMARELAANPPLYNLQIYILRKRKKATN